MLKVVKVRLYPNKSQQQLLKQHFGASRYVYNQLLDAKIKAYECNDKLSAYDLKKRLVPMKKAEGGEWLKQCDSTCLTESVLNIDVAYKKFFNGAGFPKFKSKHHSRQSYKTMNPKIKNKKVYLPKIGEIKSKIHREIEGTIKSGTISFEANQYHISLLFDDNQEFIKPKGNGKSIGIDVGVKLFATLSNGEMIKPLNLDKEINQMKKAQKRLSRRKKGSNNRTKAKVKLQKAHLKISNKRKDFLHKISNKITNENQVIVIEDLKVKNMTKSAVGTVEEPKKSSGKRGLNRVITQQSWSMFFTMLEYKAIRKGGEVIKINPKFTSQKCSYCGHVSKNNRKSQSQFKCEKCNFTQNADLNASINIVHAVGTTVKAS